MHRAQDGGGQNEPSAGLVPSLVSSSTGITNVDWGILRLTASCVLLLTRAVKKEAGRVWQECLPAALVSANAGQALTCTVWLRGEAIDRGDLDQVSEAQVV